MDMYQKRKMRAEKNNQEEKLTKVGINWYPGHMYKAKREIKDSLKLVDIIIEIRDARIPISSKNPDIEEISENRKRIIVLNKCDISDPNINNMWISYFKSKNIKAILLNSATGKGISSLEKIIREEMEETLKKDAEKGRIGRPIRCAIVGIPNVGKSTLINKMAGKNVVITANKPGVTKANKWIRLSKGIELLDTPGVLWPKFEEKIGTNLAATGAIKEEILNVYDLAFSLINILKENYKKELELRYKLENIEEANGIEIINQIGKNRGCLISGGRVDTERTSKLILEEFKNGKIGNITLEKPKG